MTDPLRREAEALVESCLTDFDHIGKPHIVDAVVAFAKAQCAAEANIIAQAEKDWRLGTSLKFYHKYGQRSFVNWLDQRAKEWET